MELTSWQGKFEALGVAVAAMTYDDVPVLKDFAAERNIGFPLLSDKGAKNVMALGILNEQYEAGHFAHGVPHPGIFFVDTQGVVRLKRAVPGYRERPSLEELYAALAALLDEAVPAGGTPGDAEEPSAGD